MKTMIKRIISMVLMLTLLFCATVPVFAAEKSDEEYLSDLRIVYADDFNEALEILAECDLEGYKLLNANLNENTGKKGVWLAYQTTTDIEDAITDISIMQMNGGYNEGNYQEMIKQSYAEYVAMGENYLTAIEYFNNAYDAGHYLTEIAYRQLNFYNVVTIGIDDEPDFEGELLGDIFYEGIQATDLATMFMEGNVHALANIRSLIAMGVSYNEDGLTYLEKVAVEAEALTNDPTVYDNENYEELANIIAPTITTFRDMFKELAAHESDLNYEDEEFTDLEIQYMECMAMAKMMKAVEYLDGKTLYDFCLSYDIAKTELTKLYPLVAALNEGQEAMTRVAHFYDVVRYSVAMESNDVIEEELAALEEKYADNPFNVYSGVDRTIYRDTFALTSEAYRADAYTESGLSAVIMGAPYSFDSMMTAVGIVGLATLTIGGAFHLENLISAKLAVKKYNEMILQYNDTWLTHSDVVINGQSHNAASLVDSFFLNGDPILDSVPDEVFNSWNHAQQYDFYLANLDPSNPAHAPYVEQLNIIKASLDEARQNSPGLKTFRDKAEAATQRYAGNMNLIYGLYIAGGILSIISAINIGISVYNYYHPTYDDIPTAMVDLIETKDGDRYIKYDVVYEAEAQKDGSYTAADLNAFQASRWNALYYTKSYEAGKPLLADEFVVSHSSNTPAKDYASVHRFGEVISYNLNKYNYNETYSIYISVKQSENNKSAVADVPEVVGSVFGTGFYFLAGGIGIIVGVGGTIGTQEIIKRRKAKAEVPAEANSEV